MGRTDAARSTAAHAMADICPYEPWMNEAVIEVVRSVHDEYGFTWEHHGYHRDLYDIPGQYLDVGGAFWVLVDGDRIVGCVGVTPHEGECELHRLYMYSSVRGRGWGRALLETAMAWGRSKGFRRMIAWSDVKLGRAHQLYLATGFRMMGQRRCDDPDESIEHGFYKEPL